MLVELDNDGVVIDDSDVIPIETMTSCPHENDRAAVGDLAGYMSAFVWLTSNT